MERAGKGIQDDQFAGRRVLPGDVLQTDLKVSETFTHQPARIPVTVIRGEEPGPTLFVTAAVHGDEINGVAITRRVLDVLEPSMLRGTLIGVPVVNRFGFTSQERYLPDRRDLNRHFPGDPTGSMANRIAHEVFKHVVRISDAGIDLHTAAGGQSNLCHIRGDADEPEVRELMRAFGTPIMMHNPGPKGSLRRAATNAHVPTIIFEAGEPSRFQHHVVEIGTEGVLRVMKHMGMLERRFRRPGVQILVRKSEWVRSNHGGLLDLSVQPGDLVRRNQRIGIIHDPFGRHVDEIKATTSGVVLSTATVPLTNPGNAIVHIGHLHKTLQSARDYVKGGGDLGHVHWVEARLASDAERKKTRAKAKAAIKAATAKEADPASAASKSMSSKATKTLSTTSKSTSSKATKTKASKTSSSASKATKTKAGKTSGSASKAIKTTKAAKTTGPSTSTPSTKKATKSTSKASTKVTKASGTATKASGTATSKTSKRQSRTEPETPDADKPARRRSREDP